MDYNKMLKAIDKAEIVSFDIYDTLVVRNVLKPTDIFKIVEFRVQSELGVNIADFEKKRILAESMARKNKKREVSLKDIYDNLDYGLELSHDIMDCEMKIELEYSQARSDMKNVYDYCCKNNKKIVITTDIYLPKEYIKSLLDKCGYKKYDWLLVSSDIGFRKRDGSLFTYLINTVKVYPRDIIHIGDNKKSDCIQARKKGIKSFQVNRITNQVLPHYTQNQAFHVTAMQNSSFIAFVNNNITKQWNSSYKFGYTTLGLPLLGFCEWVYKNAKETKKYFLARDGYLIMQVYLTLYPEEYNFVHYLYLSRKALRVPKLFIDEEFSDIIESFPELSHYDDDIIFDLYNVSDFVQENWRKIHPSSYVDCNSRRSLLQDSNCHDLLQFIKEYDKDRLSSQFELLKDYLNQEDFRGKVALIDVGWRGSAQININNICKARKIEVDISGFYFGVEDSGFSNEEYKSQMHGFFWDWGMSNTTSRAILCGKKGIFECMFLSSEGSTEGYERGDDGIVVPVRSRANSEESNIIDKIQDGALFFTDSFKSYAKRMPNYNSESAAAGLVDFLNYPTMEDMIIGDVKFENYNRSYIAKPKPISSYLKKNNSYITDLKSSVWKVGFLKRSLGLPKIGIKYFNGLYGMYRRMKGQ